MCINYKVEETRVNISLYFPPLMYLFFRLQNESHLESVETLREELKGVSVFSVSVKALASKIKLSN